ncbi:MAG: O-antigen ligase family protein [Candidatus Roizmanbacteria bacterium]|nr:O-antigen ligase family protein [Candidatus Roizmanbacteria bacterium]
MQLSVYIIASLFVVVPFIFSPFSSELFELPKMLTVYAYTAILGPLAIYRYYQLNKLLTLNRLTQLLFGSLILFYLSQLLATLFSIDRHLSWFGYYSRINGGMLSLSAYLILAVSTYILLYKEHVITVLKGVLLGGVILLLWGLPAKFGYDVTCLVATGSLSVSCWTSDFNPTVRLFSTIGQPNWYAAHLMVIALTILFIITTGTNLVNKKYVQYERYALFIMFLLTCIELVWTGSRSGMISFLIAIIIFTLGSWYKKVKLPWMYLVFAVIPLVVLLYEPIKGMVIKPVPEATPATVTEASSVATTQSVTPSSQIRLIVWKGGLELLKRYPWLGTGPETFALSYFFTRPAEHNLTSEWDFVYNKAHNEFINTAANSGYIGITLYTFMLLTMAGIAAYLFYPTKGGIRSHLALLVFSMLAGLSVSNFFGFSTSTTQLFLYLFPVLLLIYMKEPDTKAFSKPGVLAIFCYIVFLVIAGNYLIDYAAADLAYAKGKGYKNSEAIAPAYTYTAHALLRRKEPIYLDQQAYLSAQLSLYYQSVKDLKHRNQYAQQAIQMNKETLDGSPFSLTYWRSRGRIYYVLSLAYMSDKPKQSKEYLSQSQQAFKKAEEIAPTDPKNYLSHALVLSEDKPEDAKRLLRKALKLKPNYPEALEYLQLLEKSVE